MTTELFTVYTYGAGRVLENTFNAIAAMYTGGYMGQFFNLSLMLGLAWAGIKAGIMRDSATHYTKWFAGYLFVILVLLQPVDIFTNKGMTMHIRDVITGKAYKVDHLPPGLVMPAGIISGLGYSSTKLFETLFATPMPEYLPYSQYGTVFGAQVASEMRNVKIQDPIFRENVEGYITSCMLYDVMIGKKYDIRELTTSTDIWAFLNTHSSNLRMFNYRNDVHSGRELLTCKEGLKKLASGFNKESELLAKKFPQLASLASPKGATAQGQTTVKRGFTKALELTGNFYGNMNGSASDQLRQLLIINQFKDVPKSYGVLKAMQNQNTGWNMAGSLGKIGLPVMHAIFQALIYACFPIVVTLLFFSQRFQSLKTYFELMVWLELWPLLFAILNGAVSIFARDAGINEEITIGNINNIATTQSTYAMMAYGMGLAIPSLAYMIAKGGVGQFVHMAGSLMSSTQRGADVATTELTTGSRSLDNVSIGNSSYNNTSANKYDTAGSINEGVIVQRMTSGGTKTDHLFDRNSEYGDGRHYGTGAGHTHSMTNVDFSKVQSVMNSMKQGVSTSYANATKEGEQATISQQETQRQVADFMERNAESIAKGEGFDINWNSKEGETLQRMARNTMELNKKFNYEKQQMGGTAGNIALNAELQGKGGKLGELLQKAGSISGGIKGSLGVDTKAISQDIQSLTEGKNINIGKENQHVIDSVVNYGKHKKYDATQSEDKAASDSLSHSYDEYKQHSKSAEFHRTKAESMERTLEVMGSKGDVINRQQTQDFLKYFAQKPDCRGMDAAVWHTQREDEQFHEAVKGYLNKNRGPDQVVMPNLNKTSLAQKAKAIETGNTGFGSDVKQKIADQTPTNESVIKAKEGNKAKINTDTDGSAIKGTVVKKQESNKEAIQLQNVDTKKQAQEMKKGVGEKEGGSWLRKYFGFGEKNPYNEGDYDK